MAIYAYIRVSDAHKQSSSTQRHIINDYAVSNNMKVDLWSEFHLSGSTTNQKERGIESLLSKLSPGDKVLVSDVARLGRDDIHSLVRVITTITTEGAEVHFCYSKNKICPDDKNDLAKMFIIIGEAFAAVKFSEERSQKAKAACGRRNTEGLHNGRKKGAVIKSKLDKHVAMIKDRLDNGIKKTALLKELKDKHGCSVSRSRFYSWLEQRGLS
jgi:DNA invertase Pin-like site-specific DNA recombinase